VLYQAVWAVSKNRPKYPMLDIPFKVKVSCPKEEEIEKAKKENVESDLSDTN
jgi:hypothetical protein